MLHEYHRQYLLSRFRHLDGVLSEISAQLQPADDGRLFETHIADAGAGQRQVLEYYFAQIRFTLHRFTQAQAMPATAGPVSALWASRVAVSFARAAVDELRPAHLRGYGDLDAEGAATVEQLIAELLASIQRIEDYLDHGAGTGLAAHLARCGPEGDELALLRELDRIIAANRLVELRPTLELLAERATAPHFEIALFGRINAGKSSLLNWWLERQLLPTGITPLTAVITRILYGEPARARVTMAGLLSIDIGLEELAGYISETHNGGNQRGLLDVEVRLPARRLAKGLCLVDTPGLGSLAAAGPAQTLEYLPRCDLGVLLIGAGAVPGVEDMRIARAVVDGGAELLVVLSKADRLSGNELCETLAYLDSQLTGVLGTNCAPAAPVSTRPSHLKMIEVWFEQQLQPRIAGRRAQAAAALRRKILRLRGATIALLQARLRAAAEADGGAAEQSRADLERLEHWP